MAGADEGRSVNVGLHVCTFLIWTLGVAGATWLICRNCMGRSAGASDDYFAGGRSLKWYVVAGSLMLTNLSTEQLVGLNGAVYADGCLAGIWWEAGAALAMIVTATVFLPRYMALGLTTTSGFLGDRYGLALRTMVSMIFLVYYAAVLCPLVLYTGALAIRDIFDIPVPLWVVSSLIGLLGATYALVGGLRAVAVSDCLNGIGLLTVGLWVPIAAVQTLPGGFPSLFSDDNSNYLKPLVANSQLLHREADGTLTRHSGVPSVPWHVTLTGLALANMYYWSTNQVIVQRVLAAQSLANGQKGVFFAAMMKVVGFSMLCMPGIIALVMQREGVVINGKLFEVPKADEVYAQVVKAVMPSWSLGFFTAVLLGSVLSTFNSALNSAATIFGLDIYKVHLRPNATDKDVVRVAGVFGASLTLVSFFVAPQLEHVGSIFNFLQRMNSIVSLPIVVVFFVGIAASLPDSFAAKVGFAVAIVAVAAGQFVKEMQFLHLFFICFVVSSASMALATYIPALRRLAGVLPRPVPYVVDASGAKVSMAPWRPIWGVTFTIIALLICLVVSLELGLMWMFVAFGCAWFVGMVSLMMMPTDDKSVPTSCVKDDVNPTESKVELDWDSQAEEDPAASDKIVGGHGGGMPDLQLESPEQASAVGPPLEPASHQPGGAIA